MLKERSPARNNRLDVATSPLPIRLAFPNWHGKPDLHLVEHDLRFVPHDIFVRLEPAPREFAVCFHALCGDDEQKIGGPSYVIALLDLVDGFHVALEFVEAVAWRRTRCHRDRHEAGYRHADST